MKQEIKGDNMVDPVFDKNWGTALTQLFQHILFLQKKKGKIR